MKIKNTDIWQHHWLPIPMAAKLSETMSWHVGMAYNVIIFNLAELHDFKQHGSNLMNYVSLFSTEKWVLLLEG